MKSINPQHQIAAEGSLKSRSEIIKTSKIEMVLKMHPSETCEVSVSEKNQSPSEQGKNAVCGVFKFKTTNL